MNQSLWCASLLSPLFFFFCSAVLTSEKPSSCPISDALHSQKPSTFWRRYSPPAHLAACLLIRAALVTNILNITNKIRHGQSWIWVLNVSSLGCFPSLWLTPVFECAVTLLFFIGLAINLCQRKLQHHRKMCSKFLRVSECDWSHCLNPGKHFCFWITLADSLENVHTVAGMLFVFTRP